MDESHLLSAALIRIVASNRTKSPHKRIVCYTSKVTKSVIPEPVIENSKNVSTLAETGPSQREILALGLISCMVFVIVVRFFEPYASKVDDFGDSPAYMSIADAIRHWNFAGLAVKQFWGLPYAMAAISGITGISSRSALLFISFASFLASAALAHRLWGGWVASLFTLLNFDWMQRSFLGGSEPLFVALLFGAFLALRKQSYLLAALLSALATTVRPLGLVALVGIGLMLLWKREYRKFAIATAIGAAIGLAYALPLRYILGDPLATVHSYTRTPGPPLFGIPFYAIVKGTVMGSAPWTNLVLSFAWIAFILTGVGLLLTNRNYREFRQSFPVEAWFAGGYLLLICSYNLPYWARGTFARFAIPIIPFAIIGLLPWIPKSRWLVWTLALVTPVLAASSALGIVNVAHRIGLR